MKAIQLCKPFDVRKVEIKKPEPSKGQVLIKVKAVGICGSDIGAFRGTNQLVTYPRIIGHEIAGEIIAINGGNPKKFTIGDRVVVDPYLYCGHCYPCSLGRTNCCENLHVLGVHVDGGMAEYFAHPSKMLVPIPQGMSWEMAALSEPLTIALHGLHRAKVCKGEHVAISGCGPIGILMALAALSYGAIPVVIDPVEERLETVKGMGVEYIINPARENLLEKISEYTNGRMCEVVMEASGANSAIRNTLDIVSYAGRIVLTGWPKQDTLLPTGLITRKELDIRGGRTSAGEFQEALQIIKDGTIDMSRILTKTVSLDDVPGTIQDIEANPGRYLKVVATI